MNDKSPEARELELPPLDEVERELRIGAGDRADFQALRRMNTRDFPMARLAGILIALAVAPFHNAVVLGGVGWSALLILAAAALAYALGSWVVLRTWFHRSPVHLGFLFVYTDLLVFAAFVHATGGPRSLYWPIFLIRVADQMWLSRARAAVMVGLSMIVYAGLLALWSANAVPLDLDVELMKLVILGGVGLILLLVARSPWDVFERTITARDLIMRLKRQSVELDEERRRAEAAHRSKSEFLARMSHELRTPLNSVIGFSNVLLKHGGGVIGPKEDDYLVRIRQNGLHLLALVDDILDLASIEQGRMEIDTVPVSLDSLVQETVAEIAEKVADRPVTLDVDVPADLVPIAADETRLRQVLVNLVDNAVRFTDEGTVTVRVVPDRDGRTPRRLEVSDTGIGIPPQRLDRIFEAFEQADGGTARTHDGTGLGLAISRGLCALMGFHLTLDSERGVGSTFTISFPYDAPTPHIDSPDPGVAQESVP